LRSIARTPALDNDKAQSLGHLNRFADLSLTAAKPRGAFPQGLLALGEYPFRAPVGEIKHHSHESREIQIALRSDATQSQGHVVPFAGVRRLGFREGQFRLPLVIPFAHRSDSVTACDYLPNQVVFPD
jgi:hypothetical protein